MESTLNMNKQKIIRDSIYLIGHKKYEEALDKIDKMLKLSSNDFSAMYLKAMVLGTLKRYQEQLEISDNLIERNGWDLSAKTELFIGAIHVFNFKTFALLGLKQYDKAEGLIEKIIENDLQNGTTLLYKVVLLSESGNYDESIDYYEDALELFDKETIKIENTYRGKIVASLIPLDHGLNKLLIEMGKTYEKLQEYENALSCYDEALEIKPEDKEALKAKEEVLKLIENQGGK